ncbi:MAG TPA: hypothetical protein VEF04_10215, partial [Blastocatellia bacterium]|nr:hypothetical protein [Blastocatellia bacterium]
MSIIKSFSGLPRPQQEYVLSEIERLWSHYDVFVVQAPVATGKSRIAECIAKWQRGATIITPTQLLVQQYLNDFDACQSIKYRREYSSQKEYEEAKEALRRGRFPVVVNYYSHL